MKFVDVVVNIPTANAIERLCHRSCGSSPFAGSRNLILAQQHKQYRLSTELAPLQLLSQKREKKNKLGLLTKQVILPNRTIIKQDTMLKREFFFAVISIKD